MIGGQGVGTETMKL